MIKYRIAKENKADKWAWVMKKANRKCHDTEKTHRAKKKGSHQNSLQHQESESDSN